MDSKISHYGVYNTPSIGNRGFGALQIEAVANTPGSITRRHLAASELRMRGIEPNELSSSEWVWFLAMEKSERVRWVTMFKRRKKANKPWTRNMDFLPPPAYTKALDTKKDALSKAERSLCSDGSVGMPKSATPDPAPSITCSETRSNGDRLGWPILEANSAPPPSYEIVMQLKASPSACDQHDCN